MIFIIIQCEILLMCTLNNLTHMCESLPFCGSWTGHTCSPLHYGLFLHQHVIHVPFLCHPRKSHVNLAHISMETPRPHLWESRTTPLFSTIINTHLLGLFLNCLYGLYGLALSDIPSTLQLWKRLVPTPFARGL